MNTILLIALSRTTTRGAVPPRLHAPAPAVHVVKPRVNPREARSCRFDLRLTKGRTQWS
jgi:hypothetical protein